MSNVKDLLLAPRLDRAQVAELLNPFGFRDTLKADANLQAMAAEPSERELLADVLGDLLASVSKSADPDQALNYLERFARAAIHKTRLFSYLKDAPHSIDILARTLGGSPYMAEILIRDPHHLYWVADSQILRTARKKRQIERELLRTLRVLGEEQKQLDYIRFFKRREMLHIGVRDLLRLCSVEETLAALSIVAEALITAAYWISASSLRRECGIPRHAFNGFTVLAMGKLGGGELNFSSDVDLIYLYESDSEEAASMSAAGYFRRLCQKITGALNHFTGEGYVYRVDLRLRPEGAGDLALPLDGFERYYRSRAGTWERLALLKAWPVAGNRTLGHRFLEMAHPVIYESAFDVNALEDVRNMKRKIDEKMGIRDERSRNVKLGTGGIREIELIVQTLQVSNGSSNPRIIVRNTMHALHALGEETLLPLVECETLSRAYVFLRDVENKLQMTNDAQTHSLPRDPEELTAHARRLGYESADEFMRDYHFHTLAVHRIFERRFSQSN